MFGLTAASIARRTKTPCAGLDAALTAARSQVAVQTADAHQLTLKEAALVAEFDADDGAVADLLRTAGSGQFAHTAQRLRDLRAEAADRAVMEDAARDHLVRRAMESQHRLAAELLGAPSARAAADASDARAVQVSLVLLLAAHEDALPADSWRRVNPDAARYLGFLASLGYGLAEIEQRAAGQDQFPVRNNDE